MVSLKCTQCGASLQWDGTSNIARCVYCGTEFLMHPQQEKMRGGYQDPYTGRGEVQPVPLLQGSDFGGMTPLESYAPKGWKVQARQADMNLYGDQAGNPFVVQNEYYSPDGAVTITYRGPNLYTDRQTSRFPLMNGIDVMGTFLRVTTPFNAEYYCDYLVNRDVQPVSGERIRVDEADAKELQEQQKLYNQYMQSGFSQMTSEWKRITYRVQCRDGKERIVSVETRLNDGYKGQAPMQGGGLLGNIFGQFMNTSQHLWETQYELITVAESAKYENAFIEAKKIRESLKELPDLQRIRQSIMQYIQGLQTDTAMAMHQQQMASWDRRSAIIRDTNN